MIREAGPSETTTAVDDPSAEEGAFIDAAGSTDVGMRREVNEDTYLVASFQRSMRIIDSSSPIADAALASGHALGTVLMVADGMGGHGGGYIASRSAVAAIADYLINVVPYTTAPEALPTEARVSVHGLREKLGEALLVGDQAIRDESRQSSGATPEMGTTLTLAVVSWPELYVAHVGDSRCYLYRKGTLTQLTRDHTVAGQIATMGVSPVGQTSRLNHMLWNCLGGGEGSQPQPEVFKLALCPGDYVLLCTDGLTDELDEPTISAELAKAGPSREVCRRLVALANQYGGKDNITAVLAKPTGDSAGLGAPAE